MFYGEADRKRASDMAERTADTALAITSSAAQSGGALAIFQGAPRIELSVDAAIGAWLHENGRAVGADGEVNDTRTSAAYAGLLEDYRAELGRAGLDLDSADERALALLAQAWAKRPRAGVDRRGRPLAHAGQPVSASTHNLRLATVSSFYTFARRYGLHVRASELGPGEAPRTVSNPIELVKRQRTQSYAAARALAAPDVALRLAAIDRATLAGQRDYALLSLAFNTGRRVAELAALEWRDVTLAAGRATITWRHVKGGKTLYDTLDASITDALLAWLYAAYGAELGQLAPDAPLWLALSHNAKGQRRAMTPQALADVWAKRLGVSKVHASRHTFAVNMEKAGAPLTEIQRRLGHANIATTSRYMDTLASDVNPYAAELAALYGLRPAPRSAPRSGPRSPRSRVTRPLPRE